MPDTRALIEATADNSPACACCPHVGWADLLADDFLMDCWRMCPASGCLWRLCDQCERPAPKDPAAPGS